MDKIENQKNEVKNSKEDFDKTIAINTLNEFVKQDTIKKQIQRENEIQHPKEEFNKIQEENIDIKLNKKDATLKETNELNIKNESIEKSSEAIKKANEKNQIQKENNPTPVIKQNKIKNEESEENKEKIEQKAEHKIEQKAEQKAEPKTEQKIGKENTSIQVIKNEPKSKKKNKTLKIILIILVIILSIAIFSTIFSLLNINNSNIIDGIFINNKEISNLSKEDAIKYLNDELNNNEKNYITVTRNNVNEKIYLKDINGKFTFEEIVDNAYKIGRDGNIVKCNYDILFTKIFNKKLTANLEFDQKLLQNKIDEINLKMPDVALNSSYTIQNNKLIIKDSTAGVKIDIEDFKNKMINAFSTDNKEFEIAVVECAKQEIDIEKIYKEVHQEPVDAYYTTDPLKIYKEKNGVDFSISLDEAKKLLKENKSEYEIPLKEIKAAKTVNDLDNAAFPDVLASFTTTYGVGDTNRNYNIYLASKSITQTVVMPGETFSYNDLIGECSTRTGYRESTIYLNGELSTGVGGGICQVSTTLYNAVLRANLEIVERRNHSLNVTYVPLGQDAMVSIGSSDFKFKNNRDYPIKVVAYTGTGSITCEIQGLKNETEYEVKLYTKTIYKTETNAKTETYKILYLDGKEVSRTLLSTDFYKFH